MTLSGRKVPVIAIYREFLAELPIRKLKVTLRLSEFARKIKMIFLCQQRKSKAADSYKGGISYVDKKRA